jgi:Tol biopolymer transport system component
VLAAAAGSASAQMPLVTRLSALQNPRGIAWYRIDSPHFTVIYPESLATEAQRATGLLERYYAPLAASFPAQPERIPVVLNNQSLATNGYVAWSPRRSGWYAMPSPSIDAFGPIEWYRLLALHEGRHIVQEKAMREGWIGLASKVLGQNTTAFLSGTLYFPSWLWEGDAVGTETALSESGRGRVPSFTNRTRALNSAGRPYGYHAAWQGSYRTALPDWYEQGYAITTYLRRHYGDSALARAVSGSVWNPLAPFALPMALRRMTGMSLPRLNARAQEEMDSLWRAQRSRTQDTAAERLSSEAKGYRVWSQPQFAADGSVIAMYSDLDTPPQLVRLANGRREVLVSRSGIVNDLSFHVRGQRVVWSEGEADPRYGERSFLTIRILDLTTGKVRRLTDRSRYFGPTLSPDGSTIAAVHFSESRQATLVLLDAESGEERQRLPNVRARHLLTPAWSSDGRALHVVAVDTMRGNALLSMPLDGSAERVLIDYTFDAISRPLATGKWVVYGSSVSGTDNLWAVDTASLARFQVSSRRLGASMPAPSADGSRLVFADLTENGYDVAAMAIDPTGWIPAEQVSQETINYASPLAEQERALAARRGLVVEPAAPSAAWPTRPYRGLSRLLDFHSVAISPASDDVNFGLVLESTNLLNTFGLSIGGSFSDEGTFATEVGASYAGMPVILDVAGRLGSRASTFDDSAGVTRGFTWKERSLTTALRLPLTRVMGLRRQSLTLTTGIGLTHISDQRIGFRFDNNNGDFKPVHYSLSASHTRAGAYRDLLPTGASVTTTYRHTPLSGDYDGSLLSLRGALFTKGLMRNQAFVVDGGHEVKTVGNYRFAREIVFPRGFPSRFHERLSRVGLTYHLPLLYPDFAVGPLVYSRRVQGNVFADVGRGTQATADRSVDYRSVGAELTTDLAFLGTRTTTRMGVRWSKRLTGDKAWVSEFVLLLPQ